MSDCYLRDEDDEPCEEGVLGYCDVTREYHCNFHCDMHCDPNWRPFRRDHVE